MNKRRAYLRAMLLGLAMVFMVGGCTQETIDEPAAPPQTEDVAPPPTGGAARENPGEAVLAFYDWYLSYPGNVVADKAYRESPMVVAALAGEVDVLVASFDRGGYDPFLCAQNLPGEINVGTVTVSGDSAVVSVSTDLEGHTFTVELAASESGDWLITDITCGSGVGAGGVPTEGTLPADEAPEADDAVAEPEPAMGGGPREVVAGWPLFLDETYHFAMQLPAGWVHREVDIDNPNQPPAGKMERLVYLQPEGWNEDFIAFQLEVYDMDDETFTMEFSPATAEEVVTRDDGLTYTKLIHEFGPATMYQYIFRSPSDPDVRVVFTDYLTGWPDRLAGNEDVAENFQPMLDSFAFSQ
ncbi:MAG: hypothetical protein ACP5HS_09965 [Anaerolineae bacterium]